jgi:AhpD family alkylhydroperoxidase
MSDNSEPIIPDQSALYSQKVKELVAIGAAIAANCEPCFKFHYNKAHKMGISKSDILKAVETAKMVKEASATNIIDLANKYLQNDSGICSDKESCCS